MESLDTGLIVAIAASLVAWGLVSAKLNLNVAPRWRSWSSGSCSRTIPLSAIDVDVRGETLRSLAEVTLALLLFSDAARVNLRVLRHDARVPLRLLLIGLPLTMALGTAPGGGPVPGSRPLGRGGDRGGGRTDRRRARRPGRRGHARPGAHPPDPERRERVERRHRHTVRDLLHRRYRRRHRRALVDDARRVRSPISASACSSAPPSGSAARCSSSSATSRGWSSPTYRGIGVLALALLAWALSIELGGNGFIGAFVGGLAFGTVVHDPDQQETTLEFDAQTGELLSLIVWFIFGAVLVTALDATTWQTAVFAILALTVVRMVPVAIALVGTRFSPHDDRASSAGSGHAAWPRSCSP